VDVNEVRRFGATTCTIGPSWVVTELPSGAKIHAHPRGDQGETARALGYGDDVSAMTRDHDPLHAALAHWLGLPASAALREAGGEPVEPELAALEEAAVIAVQKFCRAAGRYPWSPPCA